MQIMVEAQHFGAGPI